MTSSPEEDEDLRTPGATAAATVLPSASTTLADDAADELLLLLLAADADGEELYDEYALPYPRATASFGHRAS